MKKKLIKSSITKKQAWSLILEAKIQVNTILKQNKSITIKKKIRNEIYFLIYNRDLMKIKSKNFEMDSEVQNLFNIFLPIIFNKKDSPYFIGHLAQTLDGFIATSSGESKYISCYENLEHIHRLRAISDVILVGANTVALDNPKLTTRLVKGSSPLRIVLDPKYKLSPTLDFFNTKISDGFRITCLKKKLNDPSIFQLLTENGKFRISEIQGLFKKLKKQIIFIEGGGSVISQFLKNDHLHKLHLCISPIIIGQGKNSFIQKEEKVLENIKEHKVTYYNMGNDILCDLDLS